MRPAAKARAELGLLFNADTSAEPHTRLTHEINGNQSGRSRHPDPDVTAAPLVAGMMPGGGEPSRGGGGPALDAQRYQVAAQDRQADAGLNVRAQLLIAANPP